MPAPDWNEGAPQGQRRRRGFTIVEFALVVMIMGLVFMSVSALVVQVYPMMKTNQANTANLQELGDFQTTFINDVRMASEFDSSLSTANAFTIGQYNLSGIPTYVTYQLTGGLLQRGTCANPPPAQPASWTNLIDPSAFTVATGSFAYYANSFKAPTTQASVSMIALSGLQLESLFESQKVASFSDIIASMVGAGLSAGTPPPMVLPPPTPTPTPPPHGSDSTYVMYLPNNTGSTLQLGSFNGTFTGGGAQIRYITFNYPQPTPNYAGGYKSGGAITNFQTQPSLLAPSTASIALEFHPVPNWGSTVTMNYYAASDTKHKTPYTATCSVEPTPGPTPAPVSSTYSFTWQNTIGKTLNIAALTGAFTGANGNSYLDSLNFSTGTNSQTWTAPAPGYWPGSSAQNLGFTWSVANNAKVILTSAFSDALQSGSTLTLYFYDSSDTNYASPVPASSIIP
ncbi:MAG: hypothetical protein KGR26_03480 [Cyanobacteria bacterium REEB65]|nr:hypothetical protein [Cyanobacteria bacterium REEB65]